MASSRICSVEGCNKPFHALGFCLPHYSANWRRNRLRRCSVEGCNKPVRTRGWCNTHYMRWWNTRNVDPEKPIKPGTPAGEPEKFVREIAAQYCGNDCLIWPYTKSRYGYGELFLGGRKGQKKSAHRLVCEIVHGLPSRRKMDAAHSCGNRACVNPRHLRWATRTENMADTLAHGTRIRGARNSHAKLTESDVREIRLLADTMTQPQLAARFGVGVGAISCIHQRRSWAWLE